MSFDEWVEQRYARPVVLVESSAAADATCARHGLDTIQLLRPHSVYTGGPLSARTGDRSDPVVCNQFGVRLMRTDCVRDVALTQVTRHVRRLMRGAAAMDMAYGEQLDKALQSIVEGGRSRHDGSLPHPIRASVTPAGNASGVPAAAAAGASTSSSSGGPSPPSTLLERACPTWHRSFVRDFHRLVRCSSFDTLDHPVGVLFTVATSEVGGVEGILQVFRAQAKRVAELKASLPGMDSELHQYYLILHDNTAATSPSLSTARQVLTAVQQLYGANYCALIKVNSVLDPRAVKSIDPALWVDASPAVMDVPSAHAIQRAAAAAERGGSTATSAAAATTSGAAVSAASSVTSADAFAASSSPSSRSAVLAFRAVNPTCGTWPNTHAAMLTGCYMSPEDVTEVHNVMAYYLSQSLFKYVERRLRMLDVSVQDRRTTTLGKMAAWFKGKDEARPRTADVVYPPHGSDPSVLPKYVATSLEMQMRHCGDLSLVLHDYDGAITYYRLCVEELLETLSQRPYNRAMIAACQEGIGVAQLLTRRSPSPSLTPWYTGVTSTTHRISSQTNRWEVAWNDYLAAGTQTYAVRIAFLLYEYCRTRLPPMLDRGRAILLHLQRSGVLQRQPLLNGVVNDMLAGLAVFSNAPFAAGLSMPPAIPRDYPMFISLRRFARYLQQAGAFYRADNSLDQALRCYLRVLELLRLIDPRETWADMAEHLAMTVAQLYSQLGQEVRGIAMASAAVAQGSPVYRNPETAQQAFSAFWSQQKQVLSNMGYALCPHMPMPRIVRASFHVDRNLYGTDAATDEAARRMGEAAAAAEWRLVEKQLLKTYTEAVLQAHPHYRFPFPNVGGDGGGVGGSGGNNNNGVNGGGGIVAGGGGGHGGARDGRHRANGNGGFSGAAAHAKTYDYIFYDARTSAGTSTGGGGGSARQTHPQHPQQQRHYIIARGEPLVMSFIMENPVGCPVEATDLTLLYLSYTAPDQLWKSSTTQTVSLAAGARQRVSLSFDPVAEGEYAIIGLCWSLLGQEGYYYFATRESRPGCPESLYEYAIEHPMPALEAVENIHVTVEASKACVTATFVPPIPDHLYDGEYFHTKLIVQNTSPQQDASHVVLQRSPTAAHLLYVEEFGLASNLDFEAPLVLTDHLRAQESRAFAVTIRGQHRRGDVSLQSSGNYIFALIAYLPGVPAASEQQQQLRGGLPSPTVSGAPMPPQDPDAPTAKSPQSPGAGAAATACKGSPVSPPTMVRLHRLLRRCDVQPVLAMYSTVLPPANASLKSAIVLTVKNVCAANGVRTRPFAGAGPLVSPVRSNDNVRALPRASGDTATAAGGATTPVVAPLRVARVVAVHSSRWGIECDGTDALVADRAAHCLLAHGDALSLALLVKRQPRLAGAADTTARHLFIHRSCAPGVAKNDGAASPYADTTCLALERALPSPSRIRSVETHLGTTVSQSNRNLYFLQTSCLGPGRVGARTTSDDRSGGLAFYADKAGQQREAPKTPAQRRRDEVAEEVRLCGAAMEQYTPLAVAVTWVREGADGLRKGQLFLFIDPIEHIYQTLAQQQKRQAELEAAALPRPAAVRAGSAATVEQTQQELCDAMLVRYASFKPWQGAVVSHVQVPPVVHGHLNPSSSSSSSASPTAAVPVTLRCMSFAPVPLLVTAEALPPSAPSPTVSPALQLSPVSTGSPTTTISTSATSSPLPLSRSTTSSCGEVPLLFVGKTVHTFLLMPSEVHEVRFTAHALRPGVVDCQRITLRAASMCFVHGNREAADGDEEEQEQEGVENGSMTSLVRPLMRTGMTLPALVRALLERRAPSFTSSMTTRVVLSAQQLFDKDSRGGADGGGGAVDTSRSIRSSLEHWKSLSGAPRGRSDSAASTAAAANSVALVVERYGARAAELLHQLSPRGAAASATVSQVAMLATPALTRVIFDTTPTTNAASLSPSCPGAVPHAQELARKFFRQLDAFEAEVQRAAQQGGSSSGSGGSTTTTATSPGAPLDPLLHRYIYRPTVKAMDGGGGSSSGAAYALSTNTSLALTKASTTAMMLASASTREDASMHASMGTAAASAVTEGNTNGDVGNLVPAVAPASGLEGEGTTAFSTASPAAAMSPTAPVRPALRLEIRTDMQKGGGSSGARDREDDREEQGKVMTATNGAAAAAAVCPPTTQMASCEGAVNNNNSSSGGGSADLRYYHKDDTTNGIESIANASVSMEEGVGLRDDTTTPITTDPASPLHLPVVAFERRAAAAAEALDIGEGSEGSDLVLLRRQRTNERVLGEGIHMHDNSYYGAEEDEDDDDDDTTTERTRATPRLPQRAYIGEAQAKPLVVPSSEQLMRDSPTRLPPTAAAAAATRGASVSDPLSFPPQRPTMSPQLPAPRFDTASSSTSSSSSSSSSLTSSVASSLEMMARSPSHEPAHPLA